jgi:CBS domain-containing protein
MKIQQILASKGMNVITVQPQQLVREAIALLAKHHIGALVVMGDEGKPVGILSERDIIRRAAESEDFFAESVANLMTERLITGIPEDDTFSVAATMTERRFRHLPIMDEGQLIGIVSIGDILKAERDQYRGEIDTLETRILAGEG